MTAWGGGCEAWGVQKKEGPAWPSEEGFDLAVIRIGARSRLAIAEAGAAGESSEWRPAAPDASHPLRRSDHLISGGPHRRPAVATEGEKGSAAAEDAERLSPRRRRLAAAAIPPVHPSGRSASQPACMFAGHDMIAPDPAWRRDGQTRPGWPLRISPQRSGHSRARRDQRLRRGSGSWSRTGMKP